MHSLIISAIEPGLTRRDFLTATAVLSAMSLSGIGTTGSASGFGTSAGAAGYSATAGRLRRAPDGFVRCAANEERLCFNAAGQFIGQYLQGADTYFSAPWDDGAAPHLSTSPAFLSGQVGTRIRYAGEHSEGDIFGTIGKGMVIRSEITNQFHTVNNVTPSGTVAGDLLRTHAIIGLRGVTAAGTVTLGVSNNGDFGHSFNHDANGIITSQTEAWSGRRADFHDMGTINGVRWWYLWVDALAVNINPARPRIGFGSGAAQTGKSIHVCELMIQRNPATPPAAVPVCKTAATFAADTIYTGVTNAGYVCEGLAMARSQISEGAIIPPAINIGVPYEPLETRIAIIRSAEAADRSGILHNINERFYNRPWRTPTNFTIFYGPTFIPRNWLREAEPGSACVNANIVPVFQAGEDFRPILGPEASSATFITGTLNLDGCILLGVGDPRTKMLEQADVVAGSGSTFFLNAPNISFQNGLALGGTLHSTRFRRGIQSDDTLSQQVFIGELTLQSSGGALSVQGTRTHALARTAIASTNPTTTYTLDTRHFAATSFWMDMLFVGRGTITNWLCEKMFGARTAAHRDLFFCQSERPIRISNDSGQTWANLPPAFDPAIMPHGFLAEHIGSCNFDTGSFTDAPDAARSLRVRYWEFDSIVSPAIHKPGFQWLASQMKLEDHSRLPNSGDVFRIKNGTQWIDVTFQAGEWRSGGYTRYTGPAANTPTVLAAAISNDFIQLNRQDLTITNPVNLDGCVFLGPKGGYFLTGDPALGATGSNFDNFTIRNTLVVSDGSNVLRWDHSRVTAADCFVENALFIEARSDFTYNDGLGISLTCGAAGIRNVLTIGNNVVGITSAQTGSILLGAQNDATYINAANVRTIAAGRRTNYTTFSAPSPKVAQYLPAEFYDAAQGRALLPARDRIFAFDLNPFADNDVGFSVRAVIAEAKSDHARWNAVIAELQSLYHREPDRYARIANTTAIGTSLASGLTAAAFHARYGGNGEGFFAILNGQLIVARALTGLNQIFVLRSADDEVIVVDVGP